MWVPVPEVDIRFLAQWPVMRDSTVRRLSRLHRFLFRLSGGVVGRRLVRNDMLLLTTIGRKTGSDHTVPLLYLEEAETMVVVASYGGRPRPPEWYQNLVAEPLVAVHKGRRRLGYLARTADPAERARWWPRVVAAYPGYEEYQARTDREIPIVLLEPSSE